MSPLQQLEEPIFQGLPCRLDSIDTHAGGNQFFDQARDLVVADASQRVPLASGLEAAVTAQQGLSTRREAPEAQAHALLLPAQLVERAHGNDAAAVNDGHAVADLLHLGE